jgi:transcription antitermination factor NusB
MPAQQGPRPAARFSEAVEQGHVVIRKRTRARELALQFLYQWDQRGQEALDDLAAFITEGDADTKVQEFARELIEGVIANAGAIDQKIIEVAENWDIGRMAVIDRNVLRLATYELLYASDIPPKVSINEAIDLAKKFSTAESGAFVNGILDRIRRQFCKE